MVGTTRFFSASLVVAALGLVAIPALSQPAEPGEKVHVVSPGNTLGSIARRYHVTVSALREANGLTRAQSIRLGQKLVIPAPEEASARGSSRRGDRDRDDGVEIEGGRGRHARHDGARGPHDRDDGARDRASSAGFARAPHTPGVVRLDHAGEKLEARLLGKNRHLSGTAIAGFSRLLRFYPSGAQHEIDPRLITLVGIVSDHFGGREIRVVSGFRPYRPTQFTQHSNHNLGRAMDFSIPGVPNETVRDFCRTLRDVGVGYYPNSSFVHMDVRAGKAFWIDYAGPGEAPRYHHPDARKDADEGAGEVESPPAAAVEAQGGSAPDPAPSGSPQTQPYGPVDVRNQDGSSTSSDSVKATPGTSGQ